MARVIWTDEAVANLETIVAYIAAFNPQAATRLAEKLIALADSLDHFPERGRAAGAGFRELPVVRPYVLRYRVEDDLIYIARIRHGAQASDD